MCTRDDGSLGDDVEPCLELHILESATPEFELTGGKAAERGGDCLLEDYFELGEKYLILN